jgi:hypothetical protein
VRDESAPARLTSRWIAAQDASTLKSDRVVSASALATKPGRLFFVDGPDVMALAKYADEIDVILRDIWPISPRMARRLEDLAQRMRRDATVKPNAKPFGMFGAPISGGREVCVMRERRRG